MVSCWPTSSSSRYPKILSHARLTNRIVLCSSMTIMASEAVSTIVLQTSRSCKPHLESDPESLLLVSLRSVSRLFSMSTFRKKRLSGWTSRGLGLRKVGWLGRSDLLPWNSAWVEYGHHLVG